MSYLHQKLLNFVLWLVRAVTPSQGPTISTTEKWRVRGSKPKRIDTEYGFPIDNWDRSVKFLDYILNHIPIYDLEPLIDPTIARTNLDREYGSRVPSESSNPKSLTDFFLNNTGSYFLDHDPDNEDVLIADFSDYEQYEVRPGFEKYGGKVFIKDDEIIGYEYLGERRSADDVLMDKIIRATLCVKMMVELHAIRVHICTAQQKTFQYYDKYNTDHHLADFLYISTYATLDVNRRIPVLVSPHGLVVRIFALTQNAYRQLLRDTLARPDFSREEILGTPGTTWNQELTKYAGFVDEFIRKLSEEDSADLSNFFISATALHNQFGDAQTYGMVISDFFLPKVYSARPGYVSELDQNLLVTLLVAVTPRYPLIISPHISEIFSSDQQRAAWDKFRNDILSNYPTGSWFDPKSFEISVGF